MCIRDRNKSFAPEFINRVDEIITFDQLSLEAITKIIDIELQGLYDRIEDIGYTAINISKLGNSGSLLRQIL